MSMGSVLETMFPQYRCTAGSRAGGSSPHGALLTSAGGSGLVEVALPILGYHGLIVLQDYPPNCVSSGYWSGPTLLSQIILGSVKTLL